MDNKCPVCNGLAGAEARCAEPFIGGASRYICEACGDYEIVTVTQAMYFSNGGYPFTSYQRAAMAHSLRRLQEPGKIVVLNAEMVHAAISGMKLPTPPRQAAIAIEAIGDYISETGEPYPCMQAALCALVGAANYPMFTSLWNGMIAEGLIQENKARYKIQKFDMDFETPTYDLTFKGWERYEKEKRGVIVGNYGFMAMKFDDPDLQPLFKETIKPKVKEATGYDVVEVREKSRAGVIDNIIREEIRNAAFVLADLSHGNNGAYWEAGYAEGLGKPVIYLCEQKAFDETKTHFDTNHCTTVMWSKGEEGLFAEQLIATIQRSLAAGVARGTA